jgi:hypothetical protein
MDYRIIRTGNDQAEWRKSANTANVNVFPWPVAGSADYRPATIAKMAAGNDYLIVFMETNEVEIRAEEKGFSGQVCTDSCMEFFLAADPGNSAQYLNWEFNPAGAMYLGIGTHRYDRHDIHPDNYRELFQVKTLVRDNGWSLEYHIPLTFLRGCFPLLKIKQGHVMRGNFYKCGDKTVRPHYGCWSPIDLPKPDFHCPAFFGVLTLP